MTSPTLFRRAALAALFLITTTAASAQSVPLDDPGFTDAITEQLRTALPDEHVVLVAPQRLTIGNAGSSVNLARLWQYCHANPAGCDAQSTLFVSGMVKSFKESNKPPERAQVRLAVRSAATARGMLASSRGTGLNLQVQPFFGDMVSVVVIDSPSSLRWASSHDLDALKLDVPAMRELAAANTHASQASLIEIAPPAPKGKIGAIDGGDAYTASRLLFPADWAPLAKAQGGVLIVAAPRPTTLLYLGDDAAASIDALRTLAHDTAQRFPDALGETLLRWTSDGWKTLP